MWLSGPPGDAGRSTADKAEERPITTDPYIATKIASGRRRQMLSEAHRYRLFRSARSGPDGNEIGPPATGPVPSPPIVGRRRWWALAVLCLGLLLIALDTTVLNVALPAIARELHASTSALQWVVDSYTLALGCLQLVFGGLADNLGRRRLLLLGLTVLRRAQFGRLIRSPWVPHRGAGANGYRRSSPIALHPGVRPFSLPRRT